MTAPDPLARALLPALIHKLGNATQLLTGLNAMLALDGGEELFAGRSSDLARCSGDVRDLGWALAVVASGSGSNLLLDRREPRGLEIILPLLGEASRRARGVRVSLPTPLPELTPATLSGWELPWGIASLLLAGTEDAGGDRLDWSLAPIDSANGSCAHWCLTVAGGEVLTARAESVLDRLPAIEASHESERLVVRMPPEWLRGVSR